MTVEFNILINGHVERNLLTAYAARPSDIDDDTVELIWKHLDDCETCTESFDAIREGQTPVERDPDLNAAPKPSGRPVLEPGLVYADDIEKTPPPKTVVAKIATESTIEAAIGSNSANNEKKESREAHEIEGLIIGDFRPPEKPVEQIETESAVQAGERLARENEKVPGEENEETREAKSATSANARGVNRVQRSDEDPFIDPGRRSPRQHISASDLRTRSETSPDDSRPASPTEKPAAGGRAANKSRPKIRSRQMAKSSRTATSPQKAEPLEEFLNKAVALLRRPRSAIIAGSAVVVAAAIIVAGQLIAEKKEASPVAGWAPLSVIESNAPLQELLIRRMRRGTIPPARGVDVTLDFRGISKLVIAVDLDFVGKRASSYEVVVRNPEGKSVYQEMIPQVYLDDGRAFLRLIPRLFDEGQIYALEVVAHYDDGARRVLAESAFDVVK